MNYLKNYLNSIKFIIFSYIEFNDFSKNNCKKFGIYKPKVFFSLKILIILIFKQFINKLNLIFFFYQRKKFNINFRKNYINKNIIATSLWFENCAYSWDVFFKKFSTLKKLQILEIGSFEGHSAIYFLEKFPNSIITCVDMWQNNDALKEFNFSKIEINFDKNTKKYKKNLKKYKQSSDHFFKSTKDLINYYDIIYIDGDHYYEAVFRDLLNSFKALKINGIIIIDDFIGFNLYKNYNKNPIGAVVVFINVYYRKIKILNITNQIIIKKISN